MAFTPVSGRYAYITDNATPTPNVYPGVNWTLNIDPKLDDVSNFRDGRQRSPNLGDADVSLTVIYDQDKPPDKTTGLNLIAGQEVTVKLYVNNSQSLFYQIQCRVGAVATKNEGVEKTVKQDIKLHQSGTLTYPAYT